jgi:hypothetical protein
VEVRHLHLRPLPYRFIPQPNSLLESEGFVQIEMTNTMVQKLPPSTRIPKYPDHQLYGLAVCHSLHCLVSNSYSRSRILMANRWFRISYVLLQNRNIMPKQYLRRIISKRQRQCMLVRPSASIEYSTQCGRVSMTSREWFWKLCRSIQFRLC